MRDVMELLRAKEQELLRVKRQVEALRIALPLWAAEMTIRPYPQPNRAIKEPGI
jgi:hypothetical protein